MVKGAPAREQRSEPKGEKSAMPPSAEKAQSRGSEDGQEQKEGMWASHGKQGPSGKLYLEM